MIPHWNYLGKTNLVMVTIYIFMENQAKFVVCSIISLALSFWMKHLVIGQLQKAAKFSGLEVRLSLVSFWEPAG